MVVVVVSSYSFFLAATGFLWTSIDHLLLVANQEMNENFGNRLIRPSSFVENQTVKPTTPFLIPPIEERRDWSITPGTMFWYRFCFLTPPYVLSDRFHNCSILGIEERQLCNRRRAFFAMRVRHVPTRDKRTVCWNEESCRHEKSEEYKYRRNSK